MSRNRDGVRGWRPASGEPHGGELCVARAAGREIAPHERHTLDGEPPELASLPGQQRVGDRKSTRLNSSHSQISYAVFCLKKKKTSTGGNGNRLLERPHL